MWWHASSAGANTGDAFAWYVVGCDEAATAMALLVWCLPVVLETALSLMSAGSGKSQVVMSSTKFITGQPGESNSDHVASFLDKDVYTLLPGVVAD